VACRRSRSLAAAAWTGSRHHRRENDDRRTSRCGAPATSAGSRESSLTIGLAIGVAALGAAGSAQAASLKVSGNDVVYDAPGGEINNVRAREDLGTSPIDGVTRTLVFVQSKVAPSLGAGCAADSPGVFKCDVGGASGEFRAFLGDLGDSSGQLAGGTPIALHIEGQAGADTIRGSAVADYLDGGGDNDQVEGFDGSDGLYGRGGDDTLDDDGSGSDLLDGGDGNDHLYGGIGADVLEGYYGDDVLRGEDGPDTLYGSYNNDTLFGDDSFDDTDDDAVDKFYAGGGSDEVFSDDGIKETVVDCGESFLGPGDDEAWVDQLDKPTVNHCETVFVFQRS
jgi:Ca2+-binding RTX toxin-like protein